jgi:hypothetical protein
VAARELGNHERSTSSIDGELAIDGRCGHLGHGAAETIGHAAHEAVDEPAGRVIVGDVVTAIRSRGGVEEAGGRGGVGEVGLDGGGAAVGGAVRLDDRGGASRSLVAVGLPDAGVGRVRDALVGEEDGVASSGEGARGGGADAVVRAGDDGDVPRWWLGVRRVGHRHRAPPSTRASIVRCGPALGAAGSGLDGAGITAVR